MRPAIVFLLLAVRALYAQTPLPYKDIYLNETADRLTFGNSRVKLEFSKAHGEWLSFAAADGGDLTVPASTASPAVDFRIGDTWMVAKYGAAYLRRMVTRNEEEQSVRVCLATGVAPPSRPPLIPGEWRERTPEARRKPPRASYEYELRSCYRLFADRARLQRSVSVLRLGGADLLESTYVRMEGFLFQLPRVAVGSTQDCSVEVPGPLYLDNYLPPGTRYDDVRDRYVTLGSAPDSTPGFVAIVNTKRGKTLASWLDTGGKYGYQSYLSGDGERITVLHFDQRADRMARRTEITSDTQQVEVVSGGLPQASARYREMAMRTMPLAPTPAWSNDMVLLEVLPAYFPDGLKGLTKKLPFYKGIGFNTIYLMPHWIGGYSPIDLYAVDPAIGTAADLKEMVRAAHNLGMRVLFDMVIHGFNRQSPVVREHPEFFQKNEHGIIVPHQTWGSMCTDPKNAAYQQYMVDLVKHDLREYDIDGYRVDANAFKMPNWDPQAPYAPGESGPATKELMLKMQAAMQQTKPEIVLLSEIFGPVWHAVSNLVHDNMTQGSQAILEMMDRGEFTAEQYKQHLARVVDLLPPGATRVRFARNHDTSWFYHFNGYSRRFLAMDAIHAFFGVPEVFAGDPKHGPNPDEDPEVYRFYRTICEARHRFPELASGDVLLNEIRCSNPMIFAGARRLNGKLTLVAVNLSAKEERAEIIAPDGGDSFRFVDVMGGNVKTSGKSITAKPFQILIGQTITESSK